MEEECDTLYLSSMRELTKDPTDALAVISWRDIYDSLESCADACYHEEYVSFWEVKFTPAPYGAGVFY